MNSVFLKISVCSLLFAAGVSCSKESPKSEVPAAGATAQKKADAVPVAKEQEAEPVVLKSVFEEPLQPPHTDPFFPPTKRVAYRVEKGPGPGPKPLTPSIEQIILKGVSGTDGKKFALINRKTFVAGESGTVQTSRGPVNIEVLEVKDRSVVIKIENDPEPKEVYLRPEL